MVNAPSSYAPDAAAERRERPRAAAGHSPALGASGRNPFGDLVAIQQLSVRLARGLKPVLETLLRRELRVWAEPVAVERWSDFKAGRGKELTAWQPLAMGGARVPAQLVLDGTHLLTMLDGFFGGDGEAPDTMPEEFSPAAEAFAARMADKIAAPLEAAWQPLASIAFRASTSSVLHLAPELGGEDPVVVTRFGVAAGGRAPDWIDLVYPLACLKPHMAALNVKIHGDATEIEPEWRAGLTRVVMGVKFPVRSVLAEPTLSLGRLLELREGDVIPIDFGAEVPVMVASRRLGTGQVGTANGRAAVRLISLEELSEEDFR